MILRLEKDFTQKVRFEFIKNHAFKANLAYLPSRWDDLNARGNGTYKIKDRLKLGLSFQSDKSRKVSHELSVSYEEEQIGGNSKGLEYGNKLATDTKLFHRIKFKS